MSVELISPFTLKTAVLFLVFNRPDTTRQVFDAIKQAKPPRLYIAADGPRQGREGELERVNEVRAIATAVDWPCEVKTLLRSENLGCKQAVSTGINWFFENEEKGIILEDDCLPNPDFFHFCQVLLERYAEDHRILAITGDNFQDGISRGGGSYYFSRYNHVWGWASWRRAWEHYDGRLIFWPDWKHSQKWQSEFSDLAERCYWEKIFDLAYDGKIDTWDYPWTASIWFNGGLTATPNVNLVSNIGFGLDSTHTILKNSPLARMATNTLGKIMHPPFIIRDHVADRYTFNNSIVGFKRRLLIKLQFIVSRIIRVIYSKEEP